MRRGSVVAGLLAVVAAALLLTGCSTGASQCKATTYTSEDGALTKVPVACRGEAVRLVGDTLDGARLDISTLRGKPVVLNVWGSWCGPCRKEAADLQAAATELAPDGVRVIGINTRDDDSSQAKAFQRRYGVTYPSLVDDGELLLALRGAVSPKQVPTTVVLDGQGRVAARFTGPVTRRTLVQLVKDIETQ